MTGEVTAYVAIGSNLGDRHAITASAIEMVDDLPECLVLAQSTLRETAPVGPVEQPAYLNGAIAIRTALLPRELLDRLLTIERAHGRDRQTERRWGPRRLDLDLLFFGDTVVNETDLTIPHPRLHERLFVLEPLAEIAPAIIHPTLGRTVLEMLRSMMQSSSSEPTRRIEVQEAGGAFS